MGGKTDIQKIIDEAGSQISASIGMPSAKTTTVEKEFAKNGTRKEYNVRFFNLIDDESAKDYSDFMTSIINKPGIQIVREDKSWTQEGELLRVVDYVETVAND